MTGPVISGHVGWRTNPNNTAVRVANALRKAGHEAKAVDNGYAVRIFQPGTDLQQAIVWLPIGEPTPTGLGDQYLWGKTGDEHRADGATDLNDLVALIVASLP